MFYRFLKITIGTAVRIFFRKIVVVGDENIYSGNPVILVSNHPSAFMDPLVLGILLKKPLYFFARADIFKPGFVNWITKKAHLSPIYRIVDGAELLEKNDAVFSSAYQLLFEKKTLLLFGEGFTDEVFIRRVKPMKKGSMRIALGAENKFDFKLNVDIVCAGINYADPSKFRSDLLIKFSKPIPVNKYKDSFIEHNNKAMLELNKEIYSHLRDEVIHVDNSEYAELFEQLLILSRKGINHEYYDRGISLRERWKFSKQFANSFNNMESENPHGIKILSEKCKEYFDGLKNLHVDDMEMSNIKRWSFQPIFEKVIYLVFLFPVFIFGMMNNYLPVKLSDILSKRISKRPVFWSSTNMVFSMVTVPIYYSLVVFILLKLNNHFHMLNLHLLFIFVYLAIMPLSGIFAFSYLKQFHSLIEKIKFLRLDTPKKCEVEKLSILRKSILEKMEELI